MFSIETVEVTITLFLAYLVVITLSGYFRAWVAEQVGDSTPRYAGLLSLNPIDHIDPLGVIFLVFFHFGWGRYVPINPIYISEPNQKLKLLAAYLSEACANIAIALVALISLVATFGSSIIDLVVPMVLRNVLSLKILADFYPEYSSLALSFAIILVAIVYLAVLLAALNLIVSGFRLLAMIFYPDSLGDSFLVFLLPTLMIFFLLMPLRIYVVLGIKYCAQFFAALIG